MVIKVIRLIIFFSLWISVNSYAEEKNIDYIKLMQLNLDKNKDEKVEEIYGEHEEVLSKNPMAIERLAISFEKRGKLKEAISLYENLTKGPEQLTSEKGSFYYYKLASLYVQLYFKSNAYTAQVDQEEYKEKAEYYISLAKKVNSDEEDLKLLEDKILEKTTAIINNRFQESWYATLEISSWQEKVIINKISTNENFNLLSTALGPCIGGGRKWKKLTYELNMDACFFSGHSTITSQNTLLTYQQSSISEKGIIAGPGGFYKVSENVFIGLQIPLMLRKGDWTSSIDDYKIKKTTLFGAGYVLQTKFRVSNFFIRTRLGRIFPNPGSQWSIGGLYEF